MDHSMDICQSGALNMAGAVKEQHQCTRNCSYKNEFANVFFCETSGQVHICDSTCTQKVWRDQYSTICRLSKRIFENPVNDETMNDETPRLNQERYEIN
jgi:hypothetical protein